MLAHRPYIGIRTQADREGSGHMVRCNKCGGRHDVMPRATDGKMECWDCWVKRETAADKRQKTIERKRKERTQ